jgi:WD40 repeat protein
VDFVYDGTLVASCSTDGLIRVWDTQTGQCLRTIVHEDNAGVVSVRFSPNGKFLLAWTLDGSVRLWDYVSGKCKKTYQGHRNERWAIGGAFGVYEGREGREAFVVGPSEDGRVVWWDVKSKRIVQEVVGHEGSVMWVDTSSVGGLVASGGLDGDICVWTTEPEEELREAETERTLATNMEDSLTSSMKPAKSDEPPESHRSLDAMHIDSPTPLPQPEVNLSQHPQTEPQAVPQPQTSTQPSSAPIDPSAPSPHFPLPVPEIEALTPLDSSGANTAGMNTPDIVKQMRAAALRDVEVDRYSELAGGREEGRDGTVDGEDDDVDMVGVDEVKEEPKEET